MNDFRLVDTNGIKLAVHETGSGEDTIFLLHGVTANHKVWEPIQNVLEKKMRVISVDQRGHGNSDKPSSGYEATNYGDDILGLIETLGGNGLNIIAGHSLGSRNAIVAATNKPEAVDGIVAIDFTPFIESEVFDALEERVNAGAQLFATVEEVEKYLQNRYKKIPASAISRRAKYGYERVDEGFKPLASPSAMEQTVKGLRADLSTYIAKIKVPTFIVRGAESVLVTADALAKTQELRSDLYYEIVQDADHYVPEEQPEAVVKIIKNLMSELKSK